jgi:hypothetical protein
MVVFEDEHEVPAELAEAILADPGSLDSLEDRTLALARERFPCPSGHVKMGHYATTRLKFPVAVDGTEISFELDETFYESFGQTAWELEVELPASAKTLTITRLRTFVETFLSANGIPYSYSKRNKLRNLLAGSIA